MGKKIVKYSLSMLLVVLLVLRVDIRDYIDNASSFVTDFFDTTIQNTQPATDIISLAKNNTPAQPDNKLYHYDRLIKSNNKNNGQESVIDLNKIAQENAEFEMGRVKIIAAEKFARFKAELELTKQQEQNQKQNLPPASNVQNTPALETKQLQPTQAATAIAGIQSSQKSISNKNVPAKSVTAERTVIPQPAQNTRVEPPVPATETTTVATLNTELHQLPLKTFRREPTKENNRRILEEKLFADDTVVIIVNSKNHQSITPKDIKNLYTDKMTTWRDGKNIKVYNLPVNSLTREIFSNKLLHKSPSQAATAASNRVVTNVIRNSAETKTARLVVSIVSNNPTAIGYTTYKNVKGKDNLRIVMAVE